MAVWAAEQRTRRTFRAEPAYLSPIPPDTDVSAYLTGLDMLGVGMTPQGVNVAGVMEALDDDGLPLYDDVTIQIARRSAKTTSVQAVFLGRSSSRRGYRTIQTAQDGTRASGVIKQMIRDIELTDPREPKTREWLSYASTGREYLEWNNGAHWHVVPPDPGSFRSKAADAIWFDETGELDPLKTADLEAGALPVMDTRESGQVIKSGTPGKLRAGMAWNTLKAARDAPGTLGIVDYSASDSEAVTEDQIADPDLWFRVHPGLASGLTKLKTIQKRYDTMDLHKFIREYLCVWPADMTKSALDLDRFDALTVAPVAAPADFQLSFDCEINGQAASISAGWVDPDGTERIQVMDHRRGVEWLVEELARAHFKYPRVRIGYDPIGQNAGVALKLQRVPRFRPAALKPLTLREMSGAAALVAQGMDGETIAFSEDTVLRRAAENATWRESGDNRLFGRRGGNDISGLSSGSIALHVAVQERPRQRLVVPDTMTG
jgi:hypothetical protein